jgi:hypothetical protein
MVAFGTGLFADPSFRLKRELLANQAETLDYLRDHVWWKDIVSDVKAFCETCHTCKTSKPSNQKPYGLLNPLSVPTHPWESIGVDFIGPLPESRNRDGSYDSITVVICLLTSMVHLIPSRTNYNAIQLAELMFVVFKSPVQSGFFAFFGRTGTVTGPPMFQYVKKPDRTAQNRSTSVFFGLRTGPGLNWS